jgi:hypothetical protein
MISQPNGGTPSYVSIREWCRLSGMGLTSAYLALGRGDLLAIKLGRRTVVDVEAGLRWLRAQPKWQPSTPVASRRND